MTRPLILNSLVLCLAFVLGTCGARGQDAAAVQEDGLHDAITPQPRDGRWAERHEAINKRVLQGDVDLIFVGDSITQGWEGAGKEVWQRYYASRNAANLGIGGDRTQHVLWRLENGNIEGLNPKLAVVMIGTNNSGDNTPQEIADGVKAIVEKLRAELPQTKVLLLGIFPRGEDAEDPRRIVNTKTNELISEYADGKTVHYLDIGRHFLEDDGHTLSRETMPDLLHLNQESYQTWAEAIEPTVAKLMGDDRVAAPR
jgi:lysophospholipase L1-like esterase